MTTNYDAWLKRAVRKFTKRERFGCDTILWQSVINYSKNERYATDGFRAHILVHSNRATNDGDHALNWDDFGRPNIKNTQTVITCSMSHVDKACRNALAFIGDIPNCPMRINLLKNAMEFCAENKELGRFTACLEAGSSFENNPFIYYRKGKEYSFWVNARFIREALSVYPVISSIQIMINRSGHSIFIQPSGWKDRQIPESIIMLQTVGSGIYL